MNLRTSQTDDEKETYSLYEEGYLSRRKDTDYRIYIPPSQRDCMEKYYPPTSVTPCVIYDYSRQPPADTSHGHRSYLQGKQHSNITTKNLSNYLGSNKSVTEKQDRNISNSSEMYITNIPRLTPPALLPTPSTQPLKAANRLSSDICTDENTKPGSSNQSCGKNKRPRSLLNYWKSFDPDLLRPHGRGYHLRKQRIFSPMARLWKAMQQQSLVHVMTRGLREPRALLIGNLIAFDRYWNLILINVTEYSVHLPKSALRGYGKPGRSKRRREQRLRSMQRRQLEMNTSENQLQNAISNEVLFEAEETSQLDLSQSVDYVKENIPNVLMEATNTYDDDNNNNNIQRSDKCIQVASDTSNWKPSMVNFQKRGISELSDIALWKSLQPSSSSSLAPVEQVNNESEYKEQLFIRGANIISVRIQSNT
ncbi:unnamed protein product [Trichobilharzia szidati]|nr:unnamed protein product [Trichobilharzia szidati]